jgi:hypothetical protein
MLVYFGSTLHRLQPLHIDAGTARAACGGPVDTERLPPPEASMPQDGRRRRKDQGDTT